MENSPGPCLRVTVGTREDTELLDAARDDATETSVLETGPLGVPGGPYAYVTVDGRTALHSAVTRETIRRLVDSCEAGELPTEGAEAVVDDISPPHPSVGPLSVGTRTVLDGCGWHEPQEVLNPVASDAESDPERALETVEKVGIRGRGRADVAVDEPVAGTWRRTRAADGDPVVVVHANDGDPEARSDRLLCASAAGRVHDAAEAVAAVVGSEDIAVFASEDDPLLVDRLENAGDWTVATGADEFRLGEPTMALEALEGNDRIEARRRPPGPEEWGLYGRPTLVHTPRTLLQLAELWQTPETFDAETGDPRTRLVTVGGDVPQPATVELRTDVPLATALEAVETPPSRRFIVGGRFGGLTRSLDVPASAPSLSAAGLGTEGIVEVLDGGHCVVSAIGERAAFAREENCGRCVPCREGSKQLHEALRAVYDGTFAGDDIRELARVMGSTSLCAFGEAAARPVETGLEEFEGEFRAHAEGRCPAGACGGLQ